MKTIVSVIFSLLVCLAVNANEFDEDVKYGVRPASSVYDPTGVLTRKEVDEISEPLQKILKNGGIDVIVVILPELGEAPPDYVARGFAKTWSVSDMNAVVLHVTGNPESPWIFPGTEVSSLTKPEEIEELISEAEKRAAAEPDDFGKVRAASNEAADAIRFLIGGAGIRNEMVISERLKRQLEFEKRTRLLKISGALAVAAIIMIAGFVFLLLLSRKRRPKYFPTIRKTPRFGAPYAGGNYAVSKFRIYSR